MRTISVEIPEDDEAEVTMRQIAAHLREGVQVLALRRPAVPLAWMPALASKCVQLLQAAERAAAARVDATRAN
jgi:hypothetical protein